MTNKPRAERRAWRTDDEWARLRERITAGDVIPPRDARRFAVAPARWMVAAAAVVIVAAGVSWRAQRLARHSAAPAPVVRVATTRVGERLTIRLGDSSLITLGPVSTLRYSSSATARSVAVDGIADFNITHDAARPFQVRAKNTLVTDIGTEFVVRAYAADSGVEVSVASGLVAVSAGTADSVELRAGQVAHVMRDGRALRVAGASARTSAAWIQGRLVFDDVPVGTMARELERWFDVQIRVPDQHLAERRVSATYSQPTLSGVLDALTASLPVRYRRLGNVVTIFPAAP